MVLGVSTSGKLMSELLQYVSFYIRHMQHQHNFIDEIFVNIADLSNFRGDFFNTENSG